MSEPEQERWTKLENSRYQTVRSKKMAMFNTSSTELHHLVIAWIAISFAFAIVLGWRELDHQPSVQQVFGPFIVDLMILSMIAVGISFIAHEMGHKFVAQQYGVWAEFRMSPGMLVFAIFFAWEIGWIIAAPGAVQIFGHNLSKTQMGKIAAAGPMMNIFLAFVFMPLLSDTGFLFQIGQLGVIINIVLAGFNMLPVSVLDGRKVLAWNPAVYMGLMILVIMVALILLPMAL